jgi:hypothetical protein
MIKPTPKKLVELCLNNRRYSQDDVVNRPLRFWHVWIRSLHMTKTYKRDDDKHYRTVVILRRIGRPD